MWSDLAYSVRLFRRRPAFGIGTVLTLALGIGVTTAVYAVVYGVLLRPLPVRDEATLVVVYATTSIRNDAPISFPRYTAWRDSGAFEALAGITLAGFDLTEGIAENVKAAGVTANFFSVTGGTPQLGRTLQSGDGGIAEAPAVISDQLWRRRFGADAAILGRSIKAGQRRLTVVGVMAPRFERWRGEAHIWVPMDAVHSATVLASPGYHVVTPVGRLRSSGEGEAARRLAIVDGQLDTVGQLRSRDNRGVRIVTLRDDVVPARFERLILALFAAGALTWLIVCANVATLLMVRGVEREQEIAVRLAAGASRARIVRQLVVESGVVASIGGLLGGLLAYWTLRSLVRTAPVGLLDPGAVLFDWPIILFAGAAIVITTILCGVLPAMKASNQTLHRVSRQQAAAGTRRLSHALIAAQLAGALVVLVGALLVTKSLARMEQTDLGFNGEKVFTASVNLPTSRFGSPTSNADSRFVPVQRHLLEQVSTIPGVDVATIGDSIFIPGIDSRTSIALDDGRRFLNGNPKDLPLAPGMRWIGPDYFQLHGVRLAAGREFTPRDDSTGPSVVLVNETMARLHWPNRQALGRRINLGYRVKGNYDEPWAEIVGVVADIRHGGIELPVKPEIYLPIMQRSRQVFSIMLRTSHADTVLPELRRRLRAFDAEMPVFNMRALDDAVSDATATTRYSTRLLMLSALLASILCGVGVYSAFAYVVTARRREFGIRIALGARPRILARDVLLRAAAVAGIGLAAGVPLALASSTALSSLLFEVSPRDPVVATVAAAALALLALAAAWVPARRAAAVDPILALRDV